MGISGLSALGAALGGIGGFAGGTASALEEQRKEALAQQKLDQEQQYRDAQLTLQRDTLGQAASQFQQTQQGLSTPAAALFSYIGVPLPAGMAPDARIPNTIADNVLKAVQDQQKTARQQDVATRTGAFLQQAKAQPDIPGRPPMEAEAMYDPGTPATPGRPALGAEDLAAGLATRGGSLADVAALMKVLRPEDADKMWHAPAGSAYGRGSTVLGTVPAAPKDPAMDTYHVPTAQGVMEVTKNKLTGDVVSQRIIGDLPPHPPREPAQPTASVTIDALMQQYQALKRQNPSDPRLAELDARIQAQKVQMLAPGAAPYSVASQTPGTPNPIQPSATERTGQADLRASLGGIEALLKDVEANKGVLGNFASNPQGSLRRGLSDYVPTLTTSDEKKFLANLGNSVQAVKREAIGLQQTIPELKGLTDFLPDKGQVDISVIPRLEAIRDVMRRKLAERQAPFQAAPGAPKTGGWGQVTVTP